MKHLYSFANIMKYYIFFKIEFYNCSINKSRQMTSIIEYECEWCCDENCKILGLDEEHWKPFRALCHEEYDFHGGSLTKEEFDERYNGLWYVLSDFAKEQMENTEDSYRNLPWYIKQCIDWNKVWETIEVDYNVYDNYVFRKHN
jgi:hypothetical protein